MEYEQLETEVCEFVKGEFKTVVICKFNKKGYLVSHTAYTEDMTDESNITRNLKESLLIAIERNDDKQIARIQEAINIRRQRQESKKPTL